MEMTLRLDMEDSEFLAKAAAFFGKPSVEFLIQEMINDEIMKTKITLDHHNILL